MGKRQRRRRRGGDSDPVSSSDYEDPAGNVLTLRNSLSVGTIAKLREPAGGAAASADDLWRRRTELLFERLAVSWTIAGLPLEGQKELLGRFRMADSDLQRWVRGVLDEHVRAHGLDVDAS